MQGANRVENFDISADKDEPVFSLKYIKQNVQDWEKI